MRRLKDRRPRVVIGVIGCMAQRLREEIFQRAPHVELVCGTEDFLQLPEFLEEIEAEHERVVAVYGQLSQTLDRDVSLRPDRYHAYVSVMRGCDKRCTYCVVPFTRGAERSRPVADIVDEAKRLADDGCLEITLLGQTVEAYGKSFGDGTDLGVLLRQLDAIPGLQRIRFITSYPGEMTDSILRAIGEVPKACEYLHMPAQSGSDRVLRRMKRGYRRDGYVDVVARARELVPGIEIASDFIVGFPGESDEDFQETVSLMEEVRFQNAFVFRYSPRSGTPAHRLRDDIPEEVKAERNEILLRTQERISLEKNRARVGSIVEVLGEGPSKKDASRQMGRTRTHAIAVFRDPRDRTGEIVRLRVEDCTALTLFGRVVDSAE
ncbi:MAG: tRNA (N6-isopentenyl adenosine(37)-C2)-methylthiotransferase MiaB [Planctomycetes bacterium]|nr:tRNA (N6-isopentenyl adenosine(37)-C2)-methylthiotransferase MiaB [Planctomycetota bacterium]